MADNALDELARFPQDGPIRIALEAKNFKKAIQLIDKRTKNADKATEYLVALKTLILSRMPLITDKSLALVRIEESLEENSQITDLNTIDLYDHALEEILPESPESWSGFIGELRWRFVKSNPKDEGACKECFKACLLKDDLDHAIKIATSLEKSFPLKHEYVFWQITTMFLYSQSSNYSEKQKDLWGRLALGQIEKLAQATIQSKEAGALLPVRSIQNPQELLLLHFIEQTRARSEQRLEYLKNPHLDPESIVAKGEWQLWIDKLQLMSDGEQWQQLFEVTSDLLKRARTKADGRIIESRYSDWVVWDKFRKSARNLNQKDSIYKVFAELEAHLDPASGIDKPWRRNAALIWLDLMFDEINRVSESELSNHSSLSSVYPGKLAAIVQYLQKYGSTSVAYEDVRPFVEKLNPEERFNLLETLLRNTMDTPYKADEQHLMPGRVTLSPQNQDFTSTENITRLVNAYKLIYLLSSSIPEHERRSLLTSKHICIICSKSCITYCNTCLSQLAQSTMQSYGRAIKDEGNIVASLLPTDRHPADDLCILSAMCLVKLSASTNDFSNTLGSSGTGNWLRATMLLEHAWSHSKSNFQISLLLVKLYSYIGCGSLAMRAYQRLNIKQIQHNTLAHVMFDQISTLHPHPFAHNADDLSILGSPLDQFREQQKFYSNAPIQINKNIWRAFQLGSYKSIFELTDFKEKLSNSMAKVTSIVEGRKVSRLAIPNTLSTYGYATILAAPDTPNLAIYDTNDYASFPDFEAQIEVENSQNQGFTDLINSLNGGSYKHRYQANIVAEKLMTLLDAAVKEAGPKKEILQQWLYNYVHVESLGKHHEKQPVELEALSQDGIDIVRSIDHMAHLLHIALETGHNEEVWSEHDNGLSNLLEKRLEQIIKIHESEPAFHSTLRLLYTSYGLARSVIGVMEYINKLSSHGKTQSQLSKEAEGASKKLIEQIVLKSTAIKKALEESGWMDRVLESVAQDPAERHSETAQTKPIVGGFLDLVGEGFREDWAGNVLESWKDSVVGFSYFKITPPRAP